MAGVLVDPPAPTGAAWTNIAVGSVGVAVAERSAGAGGGTHLLSAGLAEAIQIALAAADWTGGMVDPKGLGSDRAAAAAFAAAGSGGALATSSITCRQWQRAGRALHHIIDPRNGLPANGPWRTASVAAATCADANAASTAAIVMGEHAAAWLPGEGLAARLVAHDGTAELVGNWPASEGGCLEYRNRTPLLAQACHYRSRSRS